jgi:hypothetical protein
MLTTIIVIGLVVVVFFFVTRRKDSLFKGVVPTGGDTKLSTGDADTGKSDSGVPWYRRPAPAPRQKRRPPTPEEWRRGRQDAAKKAASDAPTTPRNFTGGGGGEAQDGNAIEQPSDDEQRLV